MYGAIGNPFENRLHPGRVPRLLALVGWIGARTRNADTPRLRAAVARRPPLRTLNLGRARAERTGVVRRSLLLVLVLAAALGGLAGAPAQAAPGFFVGVDEDAPLWGRSQLTTSVAGALGLKAIRVGRRVTSLEGSFTDTFGPLGVHVYVVEPTAG